MLILGFICELAIAELWGWCQVGCMKFWAALMMGVMMGVMMSGLCFAEEEVKPEVSPIIVEEKAVEKVEAAEEEVAEGEKTEVEDEKEKRPDGAAGIPEDLMEDEHVRAELGVNEFTAPSISKLFDTLQFLMPLPLVDTQRDLGERMPLDRADLAIELGFLIADGFLIVQAGQMDQVERIATDLTRYGKALGAGDRINRHAASLLESAKKQDIAQLKKELAATQKDVEVELVTLRDADLAHLISLGGWIRALEVSSVAVDKQFSAERATKIMREDIADYYTEIVSGLEPRISERPNYITIRNVLSGLRNEMVIPKDEEPTHAKVKEIREQAAKLVKLALQRQD